MIRMNEPPPKFDTIRTFLRVGTCSETLANVVNRSFDHPLEPEEKAVMPLAGGMLQQGYQCGLLWGAALGAGAEAGKRFGFGTDGQARAAQASHAVVTTFRDRYETTDCFELTDSDWKTTGGAVKYFAKGGPIRCFTMAGSYGAQAFKVIDTTLNDDSFRTPDTPVSCASLVLQRIGASPEHQVMAAGFAGGLGFSGGGCGALGAAIWYAGVKHQADTGTRISYEDPSLQALLDGFIAHTEGRLECREITGRGFDGVADHAFYVKVGGCADVIEFLAKVEGTPGDGDGASEGS